MLCCNYVIDIVVSLFGVYILTFISVLTKMLLYYNLIVNESMYEHLNNNIMNFYIGNKWGFDQVQLCGLKIVDNLHDYLSVSHMLEHMRKKSNTTHVDICANLQIEEIEINNHNIITKNEKMLLVDSDSDITIEK